MIAKIKQAKEFFTQVKQEGNKVTWPTRKESLIGVVAVLIFVSIFALYFLLVDYVAFSSIHWFLGR